MSEVIFEFCTDQDLECGDLPADIILCVDPSIVVDEVLNDDVYAFVEAQVTGKTCKSKSCAKTCSTKKYWRYTFVYDDAQLILGNVLSSAKINGVFCDACFAHWVKARVDNPLLVEDTVTVDLTIAGSPQQTLQADVKVSADAGNDLEVHADGLYSAGTTTPLLVNDTATVDLTINPDVQQTLQADVKVSVDVGNIVEVHGDGIYVAAQAQEGGCDTCFMFGDGSDGDLELFTGGADRYLKRDAFFNNLTIRELAILHTYGGPSNAASPGPVSTTKVGARGETESTFHRIFVLGTLTIEGVIDADGSDAPVSVQGAGSTLSGSGYLVNNGSDFYGFGGAGAEPVAFDGIGGGADYGGLGGWGADTGLNAKGSGTFPGLDTKTLRGYADGTYPATGLGTNGRLTGFYAGGLGGAGGGGGNAASTSGGADASSGNLLSKNKVIGRRVEDLIATGFFSPTVDLGSGNHDTVQLLRTLVIGGGVGGGGGGGGGRGSTAGGAAEGGPGGGGGGGAGCVFIYAKNIDIPVTGSIRARGGNGAAGGAAIAGTNSAGGGGGGAGGGGGLIFIAYETLNNNGSITVAGGAGGAGGAPQGTYQAGDAGGAGLSGTTVKVNLTSGNFD